MATVLKLMSSTGPTWFGSPIAARRYCAGFLVERVVARARGCQRYRGRVIRRTVYVVTSPATARRHGWPVVQQRTALGRV